MKYVDRILLMLLLVFAFGLVQEATAQQKSNSQRIKDNPDGRLEYEKRMLIDPRTGKIPDDIREKELNFVLSSPTLQRKSKDLQRSGTTTWTNRGPYNVGGRTRALAIDKNNENIILAGGVSGGMWRSTNGGTSWTKTTGSSELHSVTCIAQDPRAGSTNTWYYATGEGYGNSASGGGAAYRGNGVYKSIDNGLSWVQLSSTSADPTVFSGGFQYNWNIAVNPLNGEVYCATSGGIFRSINGGTNWTNVLDGGSTSVKYTDVAISNSGVFYATISSAGTNNGIFRSTNGTTWVEVTPSGFATSYNRIVLDIAPSNQNVVYFFANTPGVGKNDHSFYKYTYLSGDGSGAGGTWLNRSTNLPAYGGSVGNLSQGSYNQYVKTKPDNENVVFIGSTNVYRSTDAFATSTNNRWIGGYSPANNVSRYPDHHPDNHAFIFLPSNSLVVLSGHDGGISKTTDVLRNNAGNEPVDWTQLNNGYLTTQPYSVAVDMVTAGDNRIMAGFQDNGKWYSSSSSGTTAWGEEVAGGDGCYTAIVPGTSQNIRYHGTQSGNVMRSIGNDPQNPTDVDGIQPSTATGQLFVNPYILDANNSNMMYYAGGTRVWRNDNLSSINSGYTFSGTSTGWTNMTGTAVTTGSVSALAVSTSPANVLYYGTTDGQVYRVDNANSGTGTKINIYTGKGFPATAYVSSIAVDRTNSNNVFVVFSNYAVLSIFYSSNAGSTWTNVSGNLEQNVDGSGNGPSVRWVEVHAPASGGKIYFVGTSTGLYYTETLNGTSTAWTQESADLIGNVVVMMIKSRSSDGLLAVATHANGLYSALIDQGGAVCNTPTGLASSSITSSSATISWTAVSGAVSYDARYRVNGSSTWTDILGLTGTSTNLSGLSASTTYEYQLRTNCSGSSSAYSASSTFTTSSTVTYCASKGNSTADEWLQRVRFNTIDNNSGNNGGYANFTNISTNVTRGSSYTVTLNPGWTSTIYREAYRVWIDFNQDGDFTDSGEQVYNQSRTTASQVSGTIPIPATATLGNTRMRVSMKYNASPTPCETFSYGEVEDYTVNITTGGAVLNGELADNQIEGNQVVKIMNLYPNPAIGKATVSIFLAQKTNVSFTLTNVHGQGVATELLRDAEGLVNHELNIDYIRKGIYFVNVITENGHKEVKKLIIE